MLHPDSNAMLAYRIAKSTYQQRADVFNLEWLAKETGLARDDIANRIHRMYDKHLVMLAAAPAVQVCGRGLYYWFGKFRAGTFVGAKDQFSKLCRQNDAIWSGYQTSGAFDFIHGACASTLDQLLWDLLSAEANNANVEWVRLCPISRALRSEHMNLWDAPADGYREYRWGRLEPSLLAKRQDQMDEADIRLFLALNKKRPIGDYFDFGVLAQASGLDLAALRTGIRTAAEENRQLVPVVYLNWQKLGLTQTAFAIRLRRDVTVDARSRIADEFAAVSEFHTVWQFADAYYDLGLMACTQTADVASLRRRIESLPEIDTFDEAEAAGQYRCWGCSLDDAAGRWEQCAAPGAGLREALA
jgi:hypothetical protein